MQERGASKRITAWLLTLGWLADTLGCLKEKQPRWQKSGPRLQGETGSYNRDIHRTVPLKAECYL